ncbi:hypothetical protein HK102_013374 [Quaeritorhiza haematococci]|nr:hypothetical protein HK102_013374 [Quaeritorhiza haematococci]
MPIRPNVFVPGLPTPSSASPLNPCPSPQPVESSSSGDMVWLKSFLDGRGLVQKASKIESARGLKLSQFRQAVVAVKRLQERLQAIAESLEERKDMVGEEESKKLKQESEDIQKEVDEIMSTIESDEVVRAIKFKIAKAARKRRWRKRHIKKLQKRRDEKKKLRESLNRDIDKWRAEWIRQEQERQEEAKKKEEVQACIQRAKSLQAKHQELKTLIEKLQTLRNLRREKAKKEGLFFPEEDDEFFEKIKRLNEAMVLEQEKVDRANAEAVEVRRREAVRESMAGTEEGTRRNGYSRSSEDAEHDPFYEHYFQAEFDLDALVNIRRQWDMYIVPFGTPGSSRIPPWFVKPGTENIVLASSLRSARCSRPLAAAVATAPEQLSSDSIADFKLHNNSLTINWTKEGASGTFHYPWLRDHCQCPLCVHPSNRQKLHNSGDVPVTVQPTSVRLVPSEGWEPLLEVVWPTQSLRAKKTGPVTSNEQHVSTYELSFLKRYNYSMSEGKRRQAKRPAIWDGKMFEDRNRVVSYKDFMNSTDVMREAFRFFRDYGLLFLKDVPVEDHAIETVATSFGPIRETFYGRTWDVKSKPNAKNIAYTSLDLGLHMDLLYFEAPPGVQFLHSLQNNVKGGDSLFVDSFQAVEILKKKYPEAFEILSTVPVTFHYMNDGHHMHQRKLTINPYDRNEYMGVNYAPPFQGPLEAEEHLVVPFYDAFAKFTEIMEDPSLLYQTRLNPGDLAVFANRRVLHGRREFDAQSGSRHFKGTYVDWDDFMDKYRVLCC